MRLQRESGGPRESVPREPTACQRGAGLRVPGTGKHGVVSARDTKQEAALPREGGRTTSNRGLLSLDLKKQSFKTESFECCCVSALNSQKASTRRIALSPPRTRHSSPLSKCLGTDTSPPGGNWLPVVLSSYQVTPSTLSVLNTGMRWLGGPQGFCRLELQLGGRGGGGKKGKGGW